MKPGEHKTVQARILEYAEAIGWTFLSHEEAERRRGFDPDVLPKDRAKGRSLFFDDLLDAKIREFNPRYAEAEGALCYSGIISSYIYLLGISIFADSPVHTTISYFAKNGEI